MAEPMFDAIIVGAGIAGSTAGYLLAKQGLQVLIVERGNSAGSKNMTGGRIYSHSLEKIMPDFAREAPIERKITREKISMMTEDSNVTLDYYSGKLGAQGSDSYSVLRSVFDQWLADKAEAAGAEIIYGIRIDDLIVRDGKVCGVIAGEDEIDAQVTILADGVNSLLAQKLGFRGEIKPHQAAVGVKELIELPPKVIDDRFQCLENEGTAWLFAGTPSANQFGGGFLYTNKNSISLGVVSSLSAVVKGNTSVPQMLENFKRHPVIEPLIKGGTLLEYSAHLVPEGGLGMVPKIVGDGVLVIGDAAGFCINLGYAVRGMDLTIGSAECAANAVLAAKEAGDFSARFLAAYETNLNSSFVMKDLNLYKNFPHFMEETPRIFGDYPQLAADILAEMFVIDGQPAQPLMKAMLKQIKKVGLMNVAKDAWKGVRAL